MVASVGLYSTTSLFPIFYLRIAYSCYILCTGCHLTRFCAHLIIPCSASKSRLVAFHGVNTSCFAVVFRLHSGSVGGFRRLKKRVATTLILTIYYINSKKIIKNYVGFSHYVYILVKIIILKRKGEIMTSDKLSREEEVRYRITCLKYAQEIFLHNPTGAFDDVGANKVSKTIIGIAEDFTKHILKD